MRERGRTIDVVAVARTWEELNRARTMLDNWAREPRPSGFDAEVSLEITRIEQAILKGDVRLLKEVSPWQGADGGTCLSSRRRMGELVRAGRSPDHLAKEFEPSATAIRRWVEQADRDEGLRKDGPTTAERKEVRELKRELRRVKLERNILARATA